MDGQSIAIDGYLFHISRLKQREALYLKGQVNVDFLDFFLSFSPSAVFLRTGFDFFVRSEILVGDGVVDQVAVRGAIVIRSPHRNSAFFRLWKNQSLNLRAFEIRNANVKFFDTKSEKDTLYS